MSALTEKVAREHRYYRGLGICRCDAAIPETGCGDDRDLYAAHIAAVTEQAVRANVAAEIEAAENTRAQVQNGLRNGLPAALYDGFDQGIAHAARIAEGKQP